MQLHQLRKITPGTVGLVCRQGRLAGTVGSLVMSAIFAAAPIFWWYVKAPWVVWGGCALVALIVVPLLSGDLRAKFRGTNWLLWICPDGLWINFRSYQDQSEPDSLTVIHLDDREIAELRRHVQTYSTPSSDGGSTQQKLESLEIRLNDSDTSELAAALAADRHRKPPERTYLGFIRVSSRPAHFPVSLPAADVIRIAWRGGPHWVAPSLRKVLADLAPRLRVVENSRDDRPDWNQLSDAELDDQILELVRSGNRLDAIQLLVRRRGYSTTKAHQFIEELSGRV